MDLGEKCLLYRLEGLSVGLWKLNNLGTGEDICHANFHEAKWEVERRVPRSS